MLKLRQFIRESLKEATFGKGHDVPWNYWMRRPRTNRIQGLGDDIEQQRRDVFEPVADTFEEEVGEIKRSISTCASVRDLEDRLVRKGLDVYEIVADSTQFDQAVENNDLGELKRQVMTGLDSWATAAVQNTQQDDYNYSTLQGMMGEE